MDFKWSEIKRGDEFMTWDDISIISEVENVIRNRVGPLSYDSESYKRFIENNPWSKISKEIGDEKTDKFIKIFCSINGINYQEILKNRDDIKVTVSQFNKVFSESKKEIKIKVTF